jgi:hypothetical protein
MSESTYQPATGITIRQRISVKQLAKGDFQRDYTIEIVAGVAGLAPEPDGADTNGAVGDVLLHTLNRREPESLEILNDIALRRAEADWLSHVEAIKAAGNA